MKWIKPSEISGRVEAPPSKSMTIRALAAASLCRDEVDILNPSFCDDGLAALDVIRALGASVETSRDGLVVRGGAHEIRSELNCGESGLCIRMFAPIAALWDQSLKLKARGSLLRRPMDAIEKALVPAGVKCLTKGGFPPIQIQGPIKGGEMYLDGSMTSQVLTGMLTALPCCGQDSSLHVKNLSSRPYIEMTLSLLRHFGINIEASTDLAGFFIPGDQSYRAGSYGVEGDWSGAAFLLTAGAIAGRVIVDNLDPRSLQGDKKIAGLLEACGAQVKKSGVTVSAARGDLQAFDFDAADCPDLFPPLAVLASSCRGTSRILGVHRLRHKESDRAAVLKSELTKIGVRITISGDGMEIEGGSLQGGEMNSHGDHRIAMAGAIAGLVSDQGVKVSGWQAVNKSYPDFFRDLQTLRKEGK
jgi:3-phosphoshikimate 1-carboxyvinyltransferase